MGTPDGELDAEPGPDRRRVALLGIAAVLAVLAGVAVVLAEDARWLRLGVVAALWCVVLVGIALARRGRDEAELAEVAEIAAEAEEAEEDARERLAAARQEHEHRLAREVAAREEAERGADRARAVAAALREELDRARVVPDAVTLQSVGVPAAPPPRARLRVVGDSGPQQRVPAVPPPAPLRPAAPAPRAGGAPLRPAPPPRTDAPGADPSVLTTGSFVDQYVRAAGYAPPPDVRHDVPPEAPAERSDERPSRRAATRWPGDPTTGRTVAELLAAHAAAGGAGGRRRRDP